ncbi:hypothetical protein G9A89_002784 [Geosiphon pyriformis]|nr:hypothetical protein G9A89_002784 [Geosiphon pyriformis]
MRYPITYASKSKEKLKTSAVTPKGIQPPTWKKYKVKSPTNPSYYYTSRSTINITLTDVFTSNATSTVRQFSFQSKQRKEDLLGPYDFRTASSWKVTESEGKQEEKEKESENQEFTYQNLIPEDLEFETLNVQTPKNPNQENLEIKTPNFQAQPNQNDRNPNLINQQNLPSPPQQPIVDSMAYIPIVKLDNFTGKEDDTQVWLNNSLINKPQDFNVFKVEFLRYFSNSNSINRLVNTFTTMKQGETEAVTTYLGHFYRNLHQIQAIDTNYFTAPQILNQFIHGLCSSILQHIHPLYPGTLQDAVTHARNFESAELEANHAQAVNLVMNRSSELDSKLEKFKPTMFIFIDQSTVATENAYLPLLCTISNHLPADDAATNLSTINISNPNLSTTDNLPAAATGNILTAATTQITSGDLRPRITQNWKLAMVVHQPILSSFHQFTRSHSQNLGTGSNQNPNSQHYLSLLVTPENTTTNNPELHQQITLTNNILPATVTNDKSLAVIFPFELKETTTILLFSRATLEEKPIITMYTNAKVNEHSIKLILDNGSAGINRAASIRIITADEVTKTPIGEIDNLPIEVNGIIILIKLFKASAVMDWNMQEVQLIPAICGHFKSNHLFTLLIELKEKKPKPTWEAYQVLWADNNHNKLLPILLWDEPEEEKERGKEKGKEKDTIQANNTYIPDTYAPSQQSNYCQPKLIYVNCDKKLLSIDVCYDNDKEYQTATKFYYCTCVIECFRQPKRQEKWNNESCLACGETLLDEGMWNDIPETPIEAAWRRAVQRLDSCPYNDNKIWRMTMAKIEGALSEEIRKIKNNSSEFIELDWDPELVINLLDPEQFHEHYQNDNNEDIMPEYVHNTDAGFDLRYPGKNPIKLEPHSHICIDFKVALKILATTMIQLASRSSLAKKGINIKGEIINAGYVGNIIAMLQNNSEKAYTIDPNKKIAQAIFLPLVKIAQLVSVKNRKELGITARGIQGFELTGRIDILVNMAKKEIVDKREIISTHQSIFILPYDQYMLAIKREVKNQAQLFEAEATICKSGEIGLTNLYISANSPKNIKIPIYNPMRCIIEIPKRTIIGYLTTKVENQLPNHIPDFPQLCGYVDITSQTIYR